MSCFWTLSFGHCPVLGHSLLGSRRIRMGLATAYFNNCMENQIQGKTVVEVAINDVEYRDEKAIASVCAAINGNLDDAEIDLDWAGVTVDGVTYTAYFDTLGSEES